MRKIVLITEVMDKGVGKHVSDLFSLFNDDSDTDITVLYGEERVDQSFQKIIDKNKDKFIKISNLKRKIGFSDIKSIFEIKKILKRLKPDVVHCHSSKAGLCGRIAARLSSVKNIFYSPHAYFFLKYKMGSIKRTVFLLAEKFLSRTCTSYTIATCNSEKEVYIKNKIDKESKCLLIEHGIDIKKADDEKLSEYRSKFNVSKTQTLVGAMARFEYQKDPITTLKIMENIVKKDSNAVCIFFGDGSMSEEMKNLHESISEEYRARVILPGQTDMPEISIEAMDIYLTTSLYEGLPYTLLTALACGKPVLATNVEGNRDCVKDGVSGFLFETGDVEKAVNSYINMINGNDIIKNMGLESKNIYEERFSMKQMKNNYKKIYTEETNE